MARGGLARRVKGRGLRTASLASRVAALVAIPVAILGAVSFAVNGCSFIVDAGTAQCSVDHDCASLGAALRCSDTHVCVSGTPSCATSSECFDRNPAQPSLCRKSDHACVSIVSTDCKTTLADPGDFRNDETLWFGLIQKLSGAPADTALGMMRENAVDLARTEFNTTLNGLPPQGADKPRRPLAFVACDQLADPIRAATHLVNDLHVPALIGPATSGVAIKVATQVTVPGNTLMINPSATSATITTLDDHHLLWRTCPSDTLQSTAIALLLSDDIAPNIHPDPPGPIRVAVLYKGDAYGISLSDALFQKLSFNGMTPAQNQDNYKALNYGNPDDPANTSPQTKYQAAVAQAVAFEPHVVIIVGTIEGGPNILGPIEAAWPASATFKPQYVLSDGVRNPALFSVVQSNSDFRHRILGTYPGTTGPLFDRFVTRYMSTYPSAPHPDTYAAGTYDAVFLLAYATVAIGSTPITGPNLVTGLARTVPPGTSIDVGTEQMNLALTELQAGRPIDLNGASGPLDFDIQSGDVESDIQIWCLSANASGVANGLVSSGLFYSAKTKSLAGAPNCP